MATTTGRVESLLVLPGSDDESTACVAIGSSPSDSTFLVIVRRCTDLAHTGAFKTSMIDALATALVGRQPVRATHGDTGSEITALSIQEP